MGTDLRAYQTSLNKAINLSGIGVHSGGSVSISILPAEANTGIVFRRLLEDGTHQDFPAHVNQVGATDLCTVLGDLSGVHVATIEHMMAAFSAIGLDNVIVEIDRNEVPIMDGSARIFIDAIDEVGLKHFAVKRRYIRVKKSVRAEIGGSWAEFAPYEGTRFEVVIDFDSATIGRQEFKSEVDGDVFRVGLANARTFGFMKDVERLWASGHALGSSLDNSVVIGDDNRVINPEGLRYRDEFVRHKTLDAIGDLALAGAQFIGSFRSYRGGHRLNAMVLKELLSDRTAFEIVETREPRARAYAREFVAVTGPAFAPWDI
ncbi:MAG: UDP-3-O-acyl-N-acetylglucosamine deacetylase [Ahrensia sp.]|nr:UDP-3-O-acyl-N-acetylglucosamine deacetylase [Ahrensia sp.]